MLKRYTYYIRITCTIWYRYWYWYS